MNAKKFLKQVNKLDRLIENKIAEREQWKSVATGTTVRLSEKVQSSGSQQKMADAIVNYCDIEQTICNSIASLYKARFEIISVIEKLPAVEYDILHKCYVQGLSLYDIADIYDKSYSWITTVHGKALKHVQDILNKPE